MASVKYKKRFLEALDEEIFLQRNFFRGHPVQSVYFGGGTPSLLDLSEITNILSGIRKTFDLDRNAEITLEANPDDISIPVMEGYLETGINRLSIGVQSFSDEDLVYLNRLHDASRAFDSVKIAQKAGFDNISIDLIYGIPTLSMENWQKNLEIAFSLGVPHISAYALTVEPKTALDILIKKKKLPGTEEEKVIEHFHTLMRTMKEKGFLHYEISNFCKDGYFSRHNSMYWDGGHYLGLGPAAHSYDGNTRRWNVNSILHYIDLLNRHELYYESEDLSDIQKYNEYVMVSLRTMWGCDLSKIEELFGVDAVSRFAKQVEQFLPDGRIIEKNGVYYLTDEGKLFADGISSDLFMESEDGTKG